METSSFTQVQLFFFFSSTLFWAAIEGNWELSVTGRCSHVHQGCGGTISLPSPGQEEEPASPKLSCRCFSFLPPPIPTVQCRGLTPSRHSDREETFSANRTETFNQAKHFLDGKSVFSAMMFECFLAVRSKPVNRVTTAANRSDAKSFIPPVWCVSAGVHIWLPSGTCWGSGNDVFWIQIPTFVTANKPARRDFPCGAINNTELN